MRAKPRGRFVLACAACAALAVPVTGARGSAQGSRVVDRVSASEPADEHTHALDGRGLTEGLSAGRRWRGAREWFSYTLRIFEDSPLTVVCVFAGTDGRHPEVDVLVEGRKVATRSVSSRRAEPVEAVLVVPTAWTLGKTAVTIRFEAHQPEPMPGLLEVRTVQEHLE